MRILVDTHIALWALLDPGRLPRRSRETLDSMDSPYVSCASVWEVALKHSARPDRMPIPSGRFAELCQESGFELLPIEVEHIAKTEELEPVGPGGHKDPFDRLILCQARVEHMGLLTCDEKLLAYEDINLVDGR